MSLALYSEVQRKPHQQSWTDESDSEAVPWADCLQASVKVLQGRKRSGDLLAPSGALGDSTEEGCLLDTLLRPVWSLTDFLWSAYVLILKNNGLYKIDLLLILLAF